MASIDFLESIQIADRETFNSPAPLGWHCPRISFSDSFVDTEIGCPEGWNEEKVLHNDSNSEFEFSMGAPTSDTMSQDRMPSADELFFRGKLLPLCVSREYQNMDGSSLHDAQAEEESMSNCTESRSTVRISTVSSLISASTCYIESTAEFCPMSPKAPTCSASLKELFGLRKQQLHGARDGVSHEKHVKSKVSKPANPLRMLFKSCDAVAIDFCSHSEPLLARGVKEDESGSSELSASSTSCESSQHERMHQTSSVSSLSLRSDAPHSDQFLLKRDSANPRFLDQKQPLPKSSINRDDAAESLSSKKSRDASSSITSLRWDEGGNNATSRTMMDNSSPRGSVTLEGEKDGAGLTGKQQNATSVTSARNEILGNPGRVSGGMTSPGRNNSEAMSPGKCSREQSPGRKRAVTVFSQEQPCTGGRSSCKSGSLIPELRKLERSNSISQCGRKKQEQMRNPRQRDGRKGGLERSKSYSSVRITPVLNVPPIYIGHPLRSGKGSKSAGGFGLAQFFTSKKQKAMKTSAAVTLLQQTHQNKDDTVD